MLLLLNNKWIWARDEIAVFGQRNLDGIRMRDVVVELDFVRLRNLLGRRLGHVVLHVVIQLEAVQAACAEAGRFAADDAALVCPLFVVVDHIS
jgi:hypothetical protein